MWKQHILIDPVPLIEHLDGGGASVCPSDSWSSRAAVVTATAPPAAEGGGSCIFPPLLFSPPLHLPPPPHPADSSRRTPIRLSLASHPNLAAAAATAQIVVAGLACSAGDDVSGARIKKLPPHPPPTPPFSSSCPWRRVRRAVCDSSGVCKREWGMG